MSTWGEIEEALYAGITGNSLAHEGRARLFRLSPQDLLTRYRGDRGALAAAAGVTRDTVGRWLSGRQKPGHRALLRLLRRERLGPIREARIRAGRPRAARPSQPGISVLAIDDYDRRKRVWSTHGRRMDDIRGANGFHWDPNAGGKIVDAYLAGDMREAAREFVNGIRDDFYRDGVNPDHDPDASEIGFDVLSIIFETG